MDVRLSKLPWIEIAILLVAIVLRFALLDIKPPHFDEGVNGWFADQMTRTGYYQYDPTNYHGPLHMYAVFLSQTLFGRNLWALRLPAIIASLLGVWMMLRFREFFGPTVARWAAFAMAVSPAFVFYGRYSIHESWMVLFGIMMLQGILGLWQRGLRRHLYLLVGGLTGMILTKETYLLHGISFLLAFLILWLWQKVLPSRPPQPWVRQKWTWRELAISIGLGLFAIVFFYSGTFMDFGALYGLVDTFGAWFHTGADAAGHAKTTYQIGPVNYYWLALFARYEWPSLAGLGLCAFLVGRADARLRYVAIYAGGVFVAYSIIPYKTPWCIISILWPFLLLFGVALAWLGTKLKWLPWVVGVILLGYSVAATIDLNFFHYTDEKEPYVYVQTYPEVEVLTGPLLTLAKQDPRYYHVQGEIMLDSYYPLPWMLGDFTEVGYYSKDQPPGAMDGDFIVIEAARGPKEVESKLREKYYKRTFRLRNSQDECVVYFRQSRFQDWFKNQPPLVGPEK